MGLTGAILGDIGGSKYEFGTRRFGDYDIFYDKDTKDSSYTDDTVMSLACAMAIANHSFDFERELRRLGKKHSYAGYGSNFFVWLDNPQMGPYHSYGNGSAMRCSACGEQASTLEEAETLAYHSAVVSHDHPEGLKGAMVTAGCVFLAKSGHSKDEILEYATKYYPKEDYPKSCEIPLSERREEDLKFDVSCQGSVPLAVRIFYEYDNFDAMMHYINAHEIDSDTIGAIAGSIFHSYYGHCRNILEDIKIIKSRLVPDLLEIYEAYYEEKRWPSNAKAIENFVAENPIPDDWDETIEEERKAMEDTGLKVGWSAADIPEPKKESTFKAFIKYMFNIHS